MLEEAVDILDEEENEEPAENDRLYHVTTNASAVLGSRLKSRKQLRAQGAIHAGLGGGKENQAEDLVSVTVTLSRATTIRDALKVMVRAARKEIETADALIAAMQWSNFPDSFNHLKEYRSDKKMKGRSHHGAISLYEEMAWMVADEIQSSNQNVDKPPTNRVGWIRWIERIKHMINKQNAYDAVVKFEEVLLSYIAHYPSDEFKGCEGTIGFTMTATQMAKIDTDEIKILLVAAKGAPEEVVSDECELRFRPDQLVVIGVEAAKRDAS